MQQVNPNQKPHRFGGGKPPKSAAQERSADIRWGIAGLIAVVLLAVAFGTVYLVKFGVRTYTAEVSDAGALRPGDEVRVAGITVGNIKSVELKPDHAVMKFTADSDLFVGDQTTLDVRMLTIVGGHYLAVLPAGDKPLGDAVIPRDRVVLPYSLPRVFQDAVAPLQEVDGDVLRANLAALSTSLNNSPKSIQTTLTMANTITDVLEQQNADVSRTLSVADEYLSSLGTNKDVVARLITALGTLETLLENNIWAIGALDDTAAVFNGLAPLGREWRTGNTLKPMAQPLADSIPALGETGDKLGKLLESVRALLATLQPLLPQQGQVSVDHSTTTIQAPALCIPVPGRTC